MQNIPQKKQPWVLSSKAFDELLLWLDNGTASQGQSYLEMLRRLVDYFDRKNIAASAELADHTLNRVARRLEEEGNIVSETPARYCYIIARFVFLEYLQARKEEAPLEQSSMAQELATAQAADDQADREAWLNCLDQCLDGLQQASRDLILRYYDGEQRRKIENRRALAKALGISINALSIRACRIRDKLEECVDQCTGEGQ